MTLSNTDDQIKAGPRPESGMSQGDCSNAVEKLARTIGQLPINPTAKLVAFVMRSTRIIDTKVLAQITGLSMRVVQKSKNEYATARDEAGELGFAEQSECSEPSEPGFANRTNPANQDSLSPAPRVHAPAQMESPSEINIPRQVVEDPPLSPQFEIDEATCQQFHEVCLTWGRKPDEITFDEPTIDDTNRQLAGEIKAVAVLHPDAEPRMLHAALLAALNTATAKAKEPQNGQFKGRGRSSASSYLRKTYSSEVGRMIREAANAEAQRRADLHMHKTNLERRLTGTPVRASGGGGWAAAMAASEA